jgi:hypothetical protein
MVGGVPEPGSDQERADLVAAQSGGVRLVVLPLATLPALLHRRGF